MAAGCDEIVHTGEKGGSLTWIITTGRSSQRSTQHSTLRILHYLPMAAADRDPDAPLGWADVEPAADTVTCTIGDMLMRWSDDQLQSTLPASECPEPTRLTVNHLILATRLPILRRPIATP